ncbi:hypothetical protein A3762_01440 [Oleiphilus sp. HI0125]|uniref:DUF2914 domain-containing protein n=2 Tax=Oleiphilus sp. HI0125 TaxID=1822266 RepID=UPI0007C2FBF6|nr:DUF2914 domain-containing protein [Oleiphilus sp. HI0125]KZZ57313.1 hypothetical protein A3762_01440 [Oleiphilus sp. HI0125]
MSRHQKISVGPMPSQKEDYSEYEETQVLWGRIGLIFGVVFAVAFSALYLVFEPLNDTPTVVSVIEQRKIAAAQETTIMENTQAPSEEAVVAALELKSDVEAEVDPTPVALTQRAASLTQTAVQAPVSAISTLNPAIISASLARGVDENRHPIDLLGYEVSMDGENLIKVVLHTEMLNIQGTTLFHEWFLNEKRQARVRIPINADEQLSYSSKFIDKYMTGDWSVRVSDAQGEVYALANFKVIR